MASRMKPYLVSQTAGCRTFFINTLTACCVAPLAKLAQYRLCVLIVPFLMLASAGVIATCCALITDAKSFYVLRVLLGVFESGAAPAMWFAVSQFYPSERCRRAQRVGLSASALHTAAAENP
jgi:MFS family permease